MLKWLEELDKELLLALNGLGYPYLNEFMLWMSDKYIWFPLYAYLIFRLYQKNGWDFYQPLIALILVIVITDQFTSGFMKPFFERYRPCHDPDIKNQIIYLSHCGRLYGFASSHAANTFGLASFFFIRERSKLGFWLLIWAAIVSYSRIYLGTHFPGDVIVGAFIGFLAAYLLHKTLSFILAKLKAG